MITALVIAALVWKPVWALFRMATTTKGPESREKYRARIAEWSEAFVKVIF